MRIPVIIAIASSVFFAPIFSKVAHSDGYEGGYKDAPVYRHQNYSRSSDIRGVLTPQERRILKRIHRDASARLRYGKRYTGPVTRYVEKVGYSYRKPKRYVETVHYERHGRECRPAVSVTGEERGWESRALSDAWEKWNTKVIASYGYKWANPANARSIVPECGPTRKTKFFRTKVWICDLSARPCRGI